MTADIVHGTHHAYRRLRCRCDICRAAMRAYDRAYWRRRGRQPKGNPCARGDTVYPSQKAAAGALGVSEHTLRGWIRRRDMNRLIAALIEADARAAPDTRQAA